MRPARITPECAADRILDAALVLIARYRRGLTVAIGSARDAWEREEARQCLAKVETHDKRITAGAQFAADTAIVWLGPNMHGPRIDACIAAGARRSPSPTHLTAGGL